MSVRVATRHLRRLLHDGEVPQGSQVPSPPRGDRDDEFHIGPVEYNRPRVDHDFTR